MNTTTSINGSSIHEQPFQQSNMQHTLAKAFSCVGVGLHSGKSAVLTVAPAAVNSGYVFIREDVATRKNVIPARWYNVSQTTLSTTLSNRMGVSVDTVEHLMAALSASGIDNANIHLSGSEIPIMDGSSAVFTKLINSVGLKEQERERYVIVVTKKIEVQEGDRYASLSPFPTPWFDMEINFENSSIGNQTISLPLNDATFRNLLADSRTFGFEEQLTTLRELGYAKGGSLNNAVLVAKDGICNPEGLRYENEFVRHKCLDAIGDLALAGARIIGKFNGRCSGHRMNHKLLETLLADKSAWKFVKASEAHLVNAKQAQHESWDYYTQDAAEEV